MGLVDAGKFHRLGLAVRSAAPSEDWYRHVLGAAPLAAAERPHQPPGARPKPGADLEGADTRLLWHGGYPAILLAASSPNSVVGRFLQRRGPGLHSVAWQIPDMWTSEHRLRERGIRIAAVNIPGRHFFMHPADTHGILMEWTDTFFSDDHRPDARGDEPLDPALVDPAPSEGGGIVSSASLAWITAVVADAGATAAFLAEIAGARTVEGNARRADDVEQTVDVVIGDVTLRLVTARSPRSRYGPVLAAGPRLWSYALRVPDLDAALAALQREGIETLGRDGDLAWTEPDSTLGVPIEWTS
jgi:catechol 2,3-dioxygenase-like lactoylglutathione lyase family enzyme